MIPLDIVNQFDYLLEQFLIYIYYGMGGRILFVGLIQFYFSGVCESDISVDSSRLGMTFGK